MVSLSESDIAKEVLKAPLDTNDDIPSSTKDLDKLTEIKESLRMLVSQRKIFQSLVQDPDTKEETAYIRLGGKQSMYSLNGLYLYFVMPN